MTQRGSKGSAGDRRSGGSSSQGAGSAFQAGSNRAGVAEPSPRGKRRLSLILVVIVVVIGAALWRWSLLGKTIMQDDSTIDVPQDQRTAGAAMPIIDEGVLPGGLDEGKFIVSDSSGSSVVGGGGPAANRL